MKKGLFIVFLMTGAAAALWGQPLLEQQVKTNLSGLLYGNTTTHRVAAVTLSAEFNLSSGTFKLAQQGATSGQFLGWNGTAWAPATAATLPSGTTNYTLRYNGSAWASSSALQNDGTYVSVNAAPLSGTSLYVNGPVRFDGSGFMRGAGSITGTSAAAALKLWNTTPTTGDTWYLGSQDAGTFRITGQTAGDILTSSGNDVVISDRLQVTGLGATPTTILGRNASNELSSVTLGSGLSLSAGTLSATASGVTQATTLAAGRVTLSAGSNSVTDDADMTYDATNNRLKIGTGTSSAAFNSFPIATSGTLEGFKHSANTSGNSINILGNANNASTSANAFEQISTGGASGGDPFIQFTISGAVTHSIGTDNSDGDSFKITPNSSTPGGNANASFTIMNTTPPRYGINTDAPTVPLDVAGKVRGEMFYNPIVSQATVSYGTGAGTGASTSTIDGGANGFRLAFNTGTTPIANGTILTATLPFSFPNLPVVSFTAANNTTANNFSKFVLDTKTSNTFSIRANGTLPAGNYQLDFVVWGY